MRGRLDVGLGISEHEALQKLRLIVDAKRRLRSRTPCVILHLVVTKVNERELEQFRTLAKEYDCRPLFSAPSLNLRLLPHGEPGLFLSPDELEERVAHRIQAWLPTNAEYVREPYLLIRDGKRKLSDFGSCKVVRKLSDFGSCKVVRCESPWKSVVINSDASVSICCGAWMPSEAVGSLNQQTFGEIWNGPAYRTARGSFKCTAGREADIHVNCCQCPGIML